MDAHRDPHLLVSSRLPDHPKIVELGSDAARWGWLVVLCEAKRQRPPGRFASRLVLAHLLGRYARHIPAYLRLGLLHEAPELCSRCREALGDLEAGVLVVHDWAAHQLRRAAAERQADRRDRARDVTPMSHESHIDVTPESQPERDGGVTSQRRRRDPNVMNSRACARPLQSRSLSLSPTLPDTRSSAAAAAHELFRGGGRGDSGGGGPPSPPLVDPGRG